LVRFFYFLKIEKEILAGIRTSFGFRPPLGELFAKDEDVRHFDVRILVYHVRLSMMQEVAPM
jgi:hypothetical protein